MTREELIAAGLLRPTPGYDPEVTPHRPSRLGPVLRMNAPPKRPRPAPRPEPPKREPGDRFYFRHREPPRPKHHPKRYR